MKYALWIIIGISLFAFAIYQSYMQGYRDAREIVRRDYYETSDRYTHLVGAYIQHFHEDSGDAYYDSSKLVYSNSKALYQTLKKLY